MAKYENDHNPAWAGNSASLERGNYGRGMNEGTQGEGRDGSYGYGIYDLSDRRRGSNDSYSSKLNGQPEARHTVKPKGWLQRLRRYFQNEKEVR